MTNIHLLKLPFVLVGAGVGVGVYAGLVADALDDARDAIAIAQPLPELLGQDPTVQLDTCTSTSGGAIDEHRALRLVQGLGLVPRDRTDLADLPLSKKVFGIGTSPMETCRPGIELLTSVALDSGASDHSRRERREVERKTALLVAAWLAQVPGGRETYTRCSKEGCAPADTRWVDVWWPWGAASAPDPAEVVAALFAQTKVPQSWQDPAQWANAERNAERDVLIGVAKNLVVATVRTDGVRAARFWISVYMGPEQWFMSIFFFAAIGAYVARVVLRARHAAEHTELEDWLAASLPALGFIGTVRSLSAALAKADTIVSATSAVDQAGAIADVASTLAFAFTTTLVALVLGLVTTLVERLLEGWEIRSGRRPREGA